MRIEIAGNHGIGKSTLINQLANLGIPAVEQGRMALAIDDETMCPEPDVLYILLDAPLLTCWARIRYTDPSYSWEELLPMRVKFQAVAKRFRAMIVAAENSHSTLMQVLALIQDRYVRVGIPKGRLQEAVDGISCGVWGLDFKTPRILKTHYHGVTGYRLKPRSIPQLVALGFIDTGLVGRDVVEDSIYLDQLEVIHDTELNPVRLCAASSKRDILTNPPTRPLVVATEYPNIADRWLTGLGLAHVILHTGGSTEVFAPDFADLVIDVVDTGVTMSVNGLTIIHEFMHSTTVMIAKKGQNNPAVLALRNRMLV